MANLNDQLTQALSGTCSADYLALQNLNALYCHAVDRRDFDLLHQLYHDDAHEDHSPMFNGPASQYIDMLPQALAPWAITAHSVKNAAFLVDGDQANGEIYCTAYHRMANNSREIIFHGRYVDRYEKRGGQWKFSYRSLILDWMENREITSPNQVNGMPSGAPSDADPLYERLPMFTALRSVAD